MDYVAVVRHIGSVHSWEPRFTVTCGIEGCMRKYTSYRCFREHIFKKHSDDIPMFLDDSNTMEEASNVYDHNNEATTTDFAVDVPVSERPKLYNKAMFLLKLKQERRLSQMAIDGLISDITTLLEEELSSLKKEVIQCLEGGHVSAELINNINKTLSKRISTPPFEGLQSAYLQKKYYLENFNLVVCVQSLC